MDIVQGGQGHFWTMSKRKTLFSDVFPKSLKGQPCGGHRTIEVRFRVMIPHQLCHSVRRATPRPNTTLLGRATLGDVSDVASGMHYAVHISAQCAVRSVQCAVCSEQ